MAPGSPRKPESEPVSTICPEPRATICGTTWPSTRAQPVKLTSHIAVALAASQSGARIGQ